MAITNIAGPSYMVFSGSGAFNMVQLTNGTLDPNAGEVLNHGAGDPNPSFAGTMDVSPIISATTTELARFLAKCDYRAGLAIDGGDTVTTNLDWFFSHHKNFGVRQAGGLHSKFGSITKALMVPNSLNVPQSGEATIPFSIHLCSTNGIADPYTYAAAQTLSITPDVTEKFTLGPVKEGATELDGIQGWTMDFGISVNLQRSAGTAYPTYAGIDTAAPSFRIQTNDHTFAAAIGPDGRITTGAITLYCQKLTNVQTGGVARLAAATAEHIKITIPTTKAKWTHSAVGGAINTGATVELMLRPITSAGTFLTLATASAIT